jgi:hypothetical protein
MRYFTKKAKAGYSLYRKIFILTPSAFATGGVEALFQLSRAINDLSKNAYTIFWPITKEPLLERYRFYQPIIAKKVEDKPENMVIVPEVWTDFLMPYKHAIKAIWWLSVDNNFGKFTAWDDDSIIHFYQSHYALKYLKNKGVKNLFPLFDYLGSEYLKANPAGFEKENMVCYNPLKGMNTTEKIMSRLKDVKFIPLAKMTGAEVFSTLSKSKVYIDFGHHPGKDRIPREAAKCGNCIITSSDKGASAFNEDIPIPDNNKFNEEDIEGICDCILDCLNNHEKRVSDFGTYRQIIQSQQEEFKTQVEAFFRR